MNYNKKLFIVITFLLIYLCSFPEITSAHAYIIKSTPAENQVLSKPPNKVRVQFDEEIQTVFSSIQVYDLNGKQVDDGKTRIDSKNSAVVECKLKSHLPDGTYRIQWKVVSSDGHPVEGVIPFGIGESGSLQANLQSGEQGYFPHLDLVIIRGFQFLSGAILTGLLFFYLYVISDKLFLERSIKNRYKIIVFLSYWFLLISMALNLLLQVTIEAKVPWQQAVNLHLLKDLVISSFYGRVWIIQMSLLLLLMLTLFKAFQEGKKNSGRFQKISFCLCCLYLLAKSFTSHALSANYPYISILMDYLHLLGAFIWVGCLVAMILLLPLSRKTDFKAKYKQLMKSFFQWGIMIVVILTITGLFSSFTYVSTIDSLFTSKYGGVLLIKISIFIIMMIFAALNFMKGKSENEKRWGSSLFGEVLSGFIILILAVLLTNLPTAATKPGPLNKTLVLEKNIRATLKIDPKVAGANHYEVILKDQNGKCLEGIQKVTLTFTAPNKKLTDVTINLPQVQVGRFYTKGLELNAPGKWKIHLHVLTRELDTKDLDVTASIGGQ